MTRARVLDLLAIAAVWWAIRLAASRRWLARSASDSDSEAVSSSMMGSSSALAPWV